MPSSPPVPPKAHEPEGERKQLTVLFADVQGSMELQEELDVEAWAGIVDRFVTILADGVRRFGGTVNKFTGDGIMALFGAPIAQEDHARRACFAAWQMARDIRAYAEELRQSEGVDLLVRIGLNSGEVVVGRVGEDLRIDPTALGHTVGLAQRMEALAVPGSAYLTAHTARLVEGWFRLRDLGPMTVKGAREPLGVFVLEGPVPPRAASMAGAGTSRLVGRAAEITGLEEALAQAAEGHAQVVGVVGQPGVGKSRLCDEFARTALARGITVRRTGGVSHGREVPLLPILSLLRDYFGILDGDSPVQARDRISDRLLALDPGLAEDLAMWFDFLEVPDPEHPAPVLAAEVRMRRFMEVVRRLTARRTERELLILILEDLHWFDPQSAVFIERVIESFPGTRTLVVANFRPEFSAAWMRHSYYRQIGLLPLSAEAVDELVEDLLGDDPSLAGLSDYLVDRTGGNPFFVEEMVRALIEDDTIAGRLGGYRLTRPLEQARLPATVQSVLAARIDRLAAEHKPVLQSASVIGRTFPESVLAHVMGRTAEALEDSLSALCAAELLQEAQRYPTAEYRFWHALTQEVAYGTLLIQRRARLHAAVAEAMIELDADRLDEKAGVVAWHWEQAGRPLEAARWSYRAANFALRSDLAEAMRRLRATIGLLDFAAVEPGPEALALGVRSRMRLAQVGSRSGLWAEDLEGFIAEGLALADRLGDPTLRSMLIVYSGSIKFWAGDVQAAISRFNEGVRVGEATDDPELKACMPYAAAISLLCTGPLDEGLSWVDIGLARCAGKPELGFPTMGYSAKFRLLHQRAALLMRMGRLPEAAADAEQALALARGPREQETLCWTLAMLPHLAWLSGTASDASDRIGEAVQVAEDTGNVGSLVLALEGLALTDLIGGQPKEAVASCELALATGRNKRSGLFAEASLLAHLALARLSAGDHRAAAAAASEAVEVARRQGARVHECLALLSRARVRRASGESIDAAGADLDAALVLVGEVGALTYEPFIREELGRLRGDENELREAVRLYVAIGAIGHARRLGSELDGSPQGTPAPQRGG
jgi:class 3 adenylate cyclase/tetratricopeptide (TPR) repeat protein